MENEAPISESAIAVRVARVLLRRVEDLNMTISSDRSSCCRIELGLAGKPAGDAIWVW